MALRNSMAVANFADVKNRRGKASRGRKITGLQHLPNDPSRLLITSNDSRIRLYNGEAFIADQKSVQVQYVGCK